MHKVLIYETIALRNLSFINLSTTFTLWKRQILEKLYFPSRLSSYWWLVPSQEPSYSSNGSTVKSPTFLVRSENGMSFYLFHKFCWLIVSRYSDTIASGPSIRSEAVGHGQPCSVLLTKQHSRNWGFASESLMESPLFLGLRFRHLQHRCLNTVRKHFRCDSFPYRRFWSDDS